MTNGNWESGGLTTEEANALQLQYGKNEPASGQREGFVKKALHILCEPMFLLLLTAAVIYFILGEPRDGLVMLAFVLGVIGIDVAQEWKTDKTLSALRDLSAPRVAVLRDGRETEIASVDLVPGDMMMIREGVKIPADGSILRCSDFCVDESSLTGESEPVWKTAANQTESTSDYWRRDYCYAGTLVTRGSAAVRVEAIGEVTEYGKIGTGIAKAKEEPTPLQKQTSALVRLCAGIAAALCVLVGTITWFNISGHGLRDRLTESILSGVTLAMAMIPEEFPVILAVFLSMGAWRLAQKKSLVRKLSSVETLGAVSVLCVDKTGTITMNQMSVQDLWAVGGNTEVLCETMGLACETDTYDPMEKAMLAYCEGLGIHRSHLFGGELIDEYAFTDELKMMGHIWRHDGELIVAAKGSPERLLPLCRMTEPERAEAGRKVNEMSGQGLRVIAVASAGLHSEADAPASITDCSFALLGLVGLADPPRESVREDIAVCAGAGIRVVMITGDNGVTAASVAQKIGLAHRGGVVTGDMLDKMTDGELRESVKTVSIFSRVVPEHKMRIVRAFRENGEIVAMTGDGVNDAPALKYADIGIAMGGRGSEVAREAADIILMDDNFSTIVDTVKDGRRIYDNIRKAVRYVFAIHIPIALTSLLAPILNVDPASLMLLPLHVVLLELVIDPTCSIVLERRPAERNIMRRGPRDPKEKLLSAKALSLSVLQGLAVFAASFGAYYFMLSQNPERAPVARSMGITVIMLASLFLVWVNSSDTDSILVSMKRLSGDKIMWAANLLTVLGLLLVLYTPLNSFLKLAPLSAARLLTVFVLAAASVLWYEVLKLVKRKKRL